jgi:hypothetical protein
MKCKDCKYHNKYKKMCKITYLANTISCPIESDEDVEKMDICYNCKHWMGGGDWGLSCRKDYYNCSHNGFDNACEQFERFEGGDVDG